MIRSHKPQTRFSRLPRRMLLRGAVCTSLSLGMATLTGGDLRELDRALAEASR